jgi:hypothetical protein
MPSAIPGTSEARLRRGDTDRLRARSGVGRVATLEKLARLPWSVSRQALPVGESVELGGDANLELEPLVSEVLGQWVEHRRYR